uniref:Uncharacterized protein n=1 Tax=Tetradesmus obliquus TaxID=3088 RepID=A0A383V1N7_TETOB
MAAAAATAAAAGRLLGADGRRIQGLAHTRPGHRHWPGAVAVWGHLWSAVTAAAAAAAVPGTSRKQRGGSCLQLPISVSSLLWLQLHGLRRWQQQQW